jgi:hypothetical protein
MRADSNGTALPNGHPVCYRYDADSNVITLIPLGQLAHYFDYTAHASEII